MFFSDGAPLKSEFTELYTSLFKNAPIYMKIVSALAAKVEIFKAVSKTRKAVHLTMVTSAGIANNAYKNQIQSEVSLDDLFAE